MAESEPNYLIKDEEESMQQTNIEILICFTETFHN